MSKFTDGFEVGIKFFGAISLVALIPTTMWFFVLSIVAWSLNQSGLTGDWLHYWKYWWCLGVFVLAFIGQVLVAIGGGK